jgi:hypothetical protein
MKIEFTKQFEKEQGEWKSLQQQFLNWNENSSPQEEMVNLRILFLQNLSQFHTVQKEKKEVIYEFQTSLDAIFQNQAEDFEIYFSS